MARDDREQTQVHLESLEAELADVLLALHNESCTASEVIIEVGHRRLNNTKRLITILFKTFFYQNKHRRVLYCVCYNLFFLQTMNLNV